MAIGLSKKILAVITLLTVLGAAIGLSVGYVTWGSPVTTPQKITIAIQPTEAVSEISPRAKQLEQYLESALGVDVEIYVPTTYAAVIEALRFHNADVAFMSAWPAYVANKLAQAEVQVAEVREVVIDLEKKNEPFYFSYWVVPKNSPVNMLGELRGKRVCFPSPLSTSGYVFPTAKLVELGLLSKPTNEEADPRVFFGTVVFGGGYGQCWTALKAGQVDATIIAGDVSEKLYREVIDNTRTLKKQGPIPSHAVVFSRDFKEPLKSKLVDALLGLGKPEFRDLMRKFLSGIFVEFKATNTSEHLAGLRKALEITGFKFSERLG